MKLLTATNGQGIDIPYGIFGQQQTGKESTSHMGFETSHMGYFKYLKQPNM
jgi:hypothetical protein